METAAEHEFDNEEPQITRDGQNVIEMRGDVPLPEVAELLGMADDGTDDTIGGHVVSLLGRLPQEGDQLTLGAYRATVTKVSKRRIVSIRCDRIVENGGENGSEI